MKNNVPLEKGGAEKNGGSASRGHTICDLYTTVCYEVTYGNFTDLGWQLCV